MSTKPARAAGFYPRLGVSSPFDAHHDFVTSPVFSPLVLAILRLTLATYALFVTLYQLIYDAVKTHDVDGCVPPIRFRFPACLHTTPTRAREGTWKAPTFAPGTLFRPKPRHASTGRTLTSRRRYFSYFTHLSYIGLIAYLYAAGVQTLCYALKGKSGYPLQRWPRPLQLLHSLLYSTVTTYRECTFALLRSRTRLTSTICQPSW